MWEWVGDMTEIPTDEGSCIATVINLYSRRLLGYPTSAHPRR
jgi:transposase InsO family protein